MIHITRWAALAVHRSGPWPVTGTQAQYLNALNQAYRELDYTSLIADRYWRRYHLPIDDNEAALERLMCRREVALAIVEQRQECVRLLTAPEAQAGTA